MKAKHTYIESDSKLLAEIRLKIKKELKFDDKSFKLKLRIKFFFFGGLSLILYCFLYLQTSQLFFVLNYVFLGISLLLFAFNFAHDFSHNTIFKNKKLNNLGFIAIYTLVGAHAESWKERHINSHHFAPNVEAYDTDLQITNLIRVTPNMEFKWYHKFQFVYAPIAYASYSLYWILIKDTSLLFQKIVKKETKLKYILSFLAQKSFYLICLLILPILLSHKSIGVVFIAFILMHLVQSIFLLFTFFMTHHVLKTKYPETNENGIIQTSWLMNQILSSNDMHPFSETANFILGGFNNHIAHHIFPHIHHIHYPKLNKVLYRILEENEIVPNQTSYLGGVISHLKLLKKLSVNNKL